MDRWSYSEFLPRFCHVTSGELLNLSGSPFRSLTHKGVQTSNSWRNLNNDGSYLEERLRVPSRVIEILPSERSSKVS